MTQATSESPAPRILVIDDDEDVCTTLEILLADAGLEVLTARDGNQGLHLFSVHRVDLVITDMQMPLKSGNQTISEIRQKDPGVPIIAMSGSGKAARDGVLRAAVAIGADRVIEKPFDYDDLNALVRDLLGARPRAPEDADMAGSDGAGGNR